GGECNGGKRGRGSPGKTPIVAAGGNTPEGKANPLKVRPVKGFPPARNATFGQRQFHPPRTLVTDSPPPFPAAGNAAPRPPPATPRCTRAQTPPTPVRMGARTPP